MTEPADEPPVERRRAVALRYEADEPRAPEVVGKGVGDVADRIIELANERGIPVREDSDLVELLAAVDLGEEIPTELYELVAELLAYLYRVNQSLAGPA